MEDKVNADKVTADAQAAVQALMAERNFGRMRRLPAQWRATQPEAARKKLLVLLLHQLSSSRELPLENYADMFVPSRVEAGKMAFHGHGLLIDQDVFLENGRAAWAIEELLGCKLPAFSLATARDAKKRDQQVRESNDVVIQAMCLPAGKPPQPK
jgi:hypothetical protein